jgi:hypothetical protein
MKLATECINAVVQWWAERWIPDATREAFRAAVRLRHEAWEYDVPSDYGGCLLELSCDYDPRGMLLEAVRDAGHECRGFMFSAQGLLPSKHCVLIHIGNAEAKAGYGADWLEIWRAS